MVIQYTAEKIEHISKIVHEANKVFSENNNMPSWDNCDEDLKQVTRAGVSKILNYPETTSAEIHEEWVRLKKEQGWTFGFEKNETRKTHPCILPYERLPEFEKTKDKLFISIVKALIV